MKLKSSQARWGTINNMCMWGKLKRNYRGNPKSKGKVHVKSW
jgi:hypothetical protein